MISTDDDGGDDDGGCDGGEGKDDDGCEGGGGDVSKLVALKTSSIRESEWRYWWLVEGVSQEAMTYVARMS